MKTDVDTEAPKPARRLRIAVLNRVFAPAGGGAERYSMALVRELRARHEIHVFAQQWADALPGVHMHRVSQPLAKPRWLNQLWYACATWWATRSHFDLVHSHENTWHGQVQTLHVLPVRHTLFGQRRGLAWALRVLKVLCSPRLCVYLLLERARLSLRPGRQLIVSSDTLRDTVAQAYPKTRTALRVLTPGVDLPEWRADAAARQAQQQVARQALGLPAEGLGLLLVGNDFRKKGLEVLLSALAQLEPLRAKGVWLAVVGHPAQVPAWRERAQALGLQDRVHFLGQLSDVSGAYRAVDVLVHPTREDTFAMVVLEAMAHGLPVLVSDVPWCGIASLLRHGEQALLLRNPLDPAELANQLGRLLADAALRASLGQQARHWAAAHSWAQQALGQDAIYQALAR